MFGKAAPMWRFLTRFGGPADPWGVENTRVFETYPVLAMIALGWILPDSRTTGRLPKYNPDRRKTFSITDWRYVCGLTSEFFRTRKLLSIVEWIESIANNQSPRKCDQDLLDACLCLLVALHLAERNDCLMVGNLDTGYIIVPDGERLRAELQMRCHKTGREPIEWVRTFRITQP
jgi:predicted RNase H-like nuclease